jgi:hypothetical protein
MPHSNHKPAEPPCRYAFDAAQARRLAYPLPARCAYKLREAERTLAHWASTLAAVRKHRAHRRKPSPVRLLGGCTTEDSALWLRRLPVQLAQELGYNALPAIEGLGCGPAHRREIGMIVAAADRGCELEGLLVRAQAVVAAALSGVECCPSRAGLAERMGPSRRCAVPRRAK